MLILIIFGGLMYYNAQEAAKHSEYYLKIATLGPLGIVGGVFTMLFPTKAGRPETTGDKILVLSVFLIGLALGLLNWYLIDPGFFGKLP